LVRWFVGSLVRWFVGSLVRWFEITHNRDRTGTYKIDEVLSLARLPIPPYEYKELPKELNFLKRGTRGMSPHWNRPSSNKKN
jgi:hypothetical protein